MLLKKQMDLTEALSIRRKETVCLVGGGGKTTLMFALARELAAGGRRIITTTTTKIITPGPDETEKLIIEKEPSALLRRAAEALRKYYIVTLATDRFPTGKLDGIAPRMAVSLAELPETDYLIVEADGAARHPLKAPREGEPIIPVGTALVIVMVGIDALGGRLEDGTVFRSEIAAKILGVPIGSPVTPELIADLVTLPQGMAKGSPPAARIVPFVNKVDLPDGIMKGREVARAILAKGHRQIDRIVLGQVEKADKVREVIFG